jgi:hypothetical protein
MFYQVAFEEEVRYCLWVFVTCTGGVLDYLEMLVCTDFAVSCFEHCEVICWAEFYLQSMFIL